MSMIINWVPQNSEQWVKDRRGVITASRIKDFITPTTMKKSAGFIPYACELAAEQVTGEGNSEWCGNGWTERGHEMEGEAVAIYEMVTGNEAFDVGMVYKDETKRVACSPDSLIAESGCVGGLEVKCLGQKKHVEHLYNKTLPKDHHHQVQGSLWVTGAPWWDFISYHPRFKPLIIRTLPDKRFHALLDVVVPELIERIAFIKSIST